MGKQKSRYQSLLENLSDWVLQSAKQDMLTMVNLFAINAAIVTKLLVCRGSNPALNVLVILFQGKHRQSNCLYQTS